MENKTGESVSKHLFAEEELLVYAVLDGASIPDLLANLDAYEPEYVCLYRGELEPDMAEVAPYLARLDPGSDFAEWLVEQGWGKHWGIFVVSDAGIQDMRKHCRRFLTVYDGDGKPLLFRYYDPRVLRVYLPTCNEEELAAIFGPVDSFIVEDESPDTALRFRAPGGSLQREQLGLARD